MSPRATTYMGTSLAGGTVVRLPWSAAAVPAHELPARRSPHVPAASVADLSWKRTLDVLLSLIGLVLLSPVLVFAAALVKLTSPGPILYHQERIGIDRRVEDRRARSADVGSNRRRRDRRVLVNHGRPFTIHKFRTMIQDAEHGVPALWTKDKDPRVTPVGRVLRKSRIDELPQFWNVLRGDMSVVGPRPERDYFITRIVKSVPEFRERLRAKPGITGYAQVEIGYTNTDEGLRDKLYHDLAYIQNMRLRTDLQILARTVSVVLTGKGAC